MKKDNNTLYVAVGSRGVIFTKRGFNCQLDIGKQWADVGLSGIDIAVKKDHDRIRLYTTIRDTNGEILGNILGDEWQTSLNNIYDRNFDDNGIEFKDKCGDIVFQADFVNDSTLFINGIFCNKNGDEIMITTAPDNRGAVVIVRKKGVKHSPLYTKPAPLFKYPSEQHFGERVETKT